MQRWRRSRHRSNRCMRRRYGPGSIRSARIGRAAVDEVLCKGNRGCLPACGNHKGFSGSRTFRATLGYRHPMPPPPRNPVTKLLSVTFVVAVVFRFLSRFILCRASERLIRHFSFEKMGEPCQLSGLFRRHYPCKPSEGTFFLPQTAIDAENDSWSTPHTNQGKVDRNSIYLKYSDYQVDMAP